MQLHRSVMRLSACCLALTAFLASLASSASVDQEFLAVKRPNGDSETILVDSARNGDPYTEPLAAIRFLNRDITALLANFAQHKNISQAIRDYIPIRIFIADILSKKLLSDGQMCSAHDVEGGGAYPNTTSEVIQALQKVKVGLSIVGQDLVGKVEQEVVRQDFCGLVLGPFWGVSCYGGEGFAKALNGSFEAEAPAGWVCRQLRWDGGGLGKEEVGVAAMAVPVGDRDEVEDESRLLSGKGS
jgi:hypothetical protein